MSTHTFLSLSSHFTHLSYHFFLFLSVISVKDRVPADSTVLFWISVKSSAVSWTGNSESALRVLSLSWNFLPSLGVETFIWKFLRVCVFGRPEHIIYLLIRFHNDLSIIETAKQNRFDLRRVRVLSSLNHWTGVFYRCVCIVFTMRNCLSEKSHAVHSCGRKREKKKIVMYGVGFQWMRLHLFVRSACSMVYYLHTRIFPLFIWLVSFFIPFLTTKLCTLNSVDGYSFWFSSIHRFFSLMLHKSTLISGRLIGPNFMAEANSAVTGNTNVGPHRKLLNQG